MRKYASVLLFFLSVIFLNNVGLQAQDPPVFSQYLANPYQFNPSYAAHHGYTEANVFFRKQWIGFENAPEALSFNIHTPVGKNVALGLLTYSNKTILLTTNAALATFGYKVRFGNYSNINFGLSGGMTFNNFNVDAVSNSNDPALQQIIPRTNALASQFGINLNIRSFNFGLAFPELLDSKTTRPSENTPKFSPWNNRFASLSYSHKIGKVSLTPLVVYRSLDNTQFQWEGGLFANWNDVLWVGSSYRDGYGLTLFLGFGIKGRVRVGYAYEHPTSGISRAPNSSTHEFYTGVRLGSSNRDEVILSQQINSGQPADESVSSAFDNNTDELSSTINDDNAGPGSTPPTSIRPANTEAEALTNRSAYEIAHAGDAPESAAVSSDDLNRGYYVVLGVYRNQDNALRQMGYLKRQGLVPSLMFIPEKQYFYVYVFHSQTRSDAVRERKVARRNNQFFGAWIYTIE